MSEKIPDVFFTSDTHFWHKKIIEFCPVTRPFSTVEDMNERIIEAWNDRVKVNDIVYHLGDVSFGKTEQTKEILDRLNGNIFLIRGNHDHQFDSQTLRSRMVWIGDRKQIKIDSYNIILDHFPIEAWDRKDYGLIHLHGHMHSGYSSHNKLQDIPRRMDVGIDSRLDQSPWSWEEIKLKLL